MFLGSYVYSAVLPQTSWFIRLGADGAMNNAKSNKLRVRHSTRRSLGRHVGSFTTHDLSCKWYLENAKCTHFLAIVRRNFSQLAFLENILFGGNGREQSCFLCSHLTHTQSWHEYLFLTQLFYAPPSPYDSTAHKYNNMCPWKSWFLSWSNLLILNVALYDVN